ncbi:hypothetical protein MRB53_000995 [Persea americana]|uniref:Uncharacterized protein n=1 Tax=Persea americana TaxID=3435 RepID=A0ACC2MST2_PERAE|nr:hypothetical protein MRB53_000995 [Persea americana]
MGVSKKKENLISSSSSDPLQWQKIFNALVQMLKSQQSQLQTLADDRKLLEDRIQTQHQRWLFDVRLLEDQISQLQDSCKEAELGRLLEEAKSNLVVGMKQREAFLYKSISEQSASDLEDMKQVVDSLNSNLSEQKDKPEEKTRGTGKSNARTAVNMKEEEKRSKTLRDEIRRLKYSNEKLSSQRNSEVSALVAERNFVWNQFKTMESDYTSLLKTKRVEVEQANENIAKLQSIVEKLQSSCKEKDNIIVKLNADIAKLKMDMGTRDKEISRLSKEFDLLSSSAKASLKQAVTHPTSSNCSIKSASNVGREKRTPVRKEPSEPNASEGVSRTPAAARPILSSCSMKSTSNVGREKHTVRKQTSESHASGLSMECKRSSKKQRTEAPSKLESPRLFTSGFKVPKLKISSPSLV